MFGFVSAARRLNTPAVLRKATSVPSRLMDAERLGPSSGLGSGVPESSTEQRTVRCVPTLRTKTSVAPLRSGPPSWLAVTRFAASDSKATKLPSEEMAGLELEPVPLLPEPGTGNKG